MEDARRQDLASGQAPGVSQVVPEIIAAVDLGSNSFHMIVAKHEHGELVVIDRLREMVRLAAGLTPDRGLSKESTERALDCLQRFGQRLRDMRAESVRVVGTNTLRRARNAGDFVARAEAALGHPIEVISGIEEARLIYLGAAHSLPRTDGYRLVTDIGGGSTELIIGEGTRALRMESLYIGCVGLSLRFFSDGDLTHKRFERARLVTSLELEPVKAGFRVMGWTEAIGTSGTIRATEEVLRELDPATIGITLDGLEELIVRMVKQRNVRHLELPGLSTERAPVYPGGVAILAETFRMLGIENMRSADGALREGLLYDLLGRLTDEDARERSVRAIERRFHIDADQAARVQRTALSLLERVANDWDFVTPLSRLILAWAARLHEIGLDIAHAHYQSHGAYLLEHADLAGFPREEQRLLACLVGCHRRRISRRPFKTLPKPWRRKAEYLTVLLRLSVLLHRARGPFELPEVDLHANARSLEVRFPKDWLDQHPLTNADLAQEAEWLDGIGFELKIA